uniref:Uncharacterized protein n=1 Tax=Globodera pallida TaxID=36090 RepID=A0A183BXW8_GLOPA
MGHSSIVVSLHLFLVLLVLHSSVKGSCCCCCDCCGCCCDCCCCCCGGSRNSNNAAATTAAAATGLAIGSALLANAGQQAAIAPIDAAAEETALGPELFPDGSTGRRNGQQLLVEIEHGGTAGGVFFPGRRRRRRTRRFGKMDGINFDPMFPGAGGGQNAKSVFGNEPPGLGPGLLPDGSTGRKSQHDGHNNFFDGMNFDGMHSPAAQRRQRQTQKLDKRHCGICPANECFCPQNCGEALKCPTKLKLIEIDSDLLQNYTVSRFLLGLIPKEVVPSKTKKSGRAFPEKVDAEYLSLSAEVGITSQQSSASTSVSVEDNSSSPADQKRFRPVSAVDDQQQQQKAEDLIARRLFLIPPVGAISGRMRREAASLEALPPPPLQFYKPTVPNPENADERLGVDDYD